MPPRSCPGSSEAAALRVLQIPWEKEARYRLPTRVWHEMMETYYPDGVWVRLPRETFERAREYRARGAFPSWEAALESLLAEGARGAERSNREKETGRG